MITWVDGGDVVLTGSDTATKPGGLQYSISGGNGPYTWSVEGTGVVISSSGYLTLGEAACGSFVVTCTDCTGRSDSITGRVTNNGQWNEATLERCQTTSMFSMTYLCWKTIIQGDKKYYQIWRTCSHYNSYPWGCISGGVWVDDPRVYGGSCYFEDNYSCPSIMGGPPLDVCPPSSDYEGYGSAVYDPYCPGVGAIVYFTEIQTWTC